MVSYTIHIINTPFSIPFSNLLRLHVPHATPHISQMALCSLSAGGLCLPGIATSRTNSSHITTTQAHFAM